MRGAKGNKYALGNRGGGRKSAYQERADADLLWRMFTQPMSVDQVKRMLASGRYSLLDVVVSKAFAGNDRVLCMLIQKLFPDRMQISERLGVRDERELRDLIEQGRRLQRLVDSSSSSHDEYLASCMRLLKFLLREHPEWRGRVMSELSSGAVEVDESRPASGLNEPKQNGRVGTPIPPAKRNGGNDASFGTGANEGNEQATEDG